MPNEPELRYISIETAAAMLECSPRTIRRLIASGDLTGYRIGPRLLRIRVDEIDALLRPLNPHEGTEQS